MEVNPKYGPNSLGHLRLYGLDNEDQGAKISGFAESYRIMNEWDEELILRKMALQNKAFGISRRETVRMIPQEKIDQLAAAGHSAEDIGEMISKGELK